MRARSVSRSGPVAISSGSFERFASFLLDAQTAILADAEAAEAAAAEVKAEAGEVGDSAAAVGATFLRDSWARGEDGAQVPPSKGVTAVLEGGVLWEKAAASVSIVNGLLTEERAASLSAGKDIPYSAGEQYSACALSLVFHARSPRVPTLRGDVRFFELPGRGESWFGGGADLTPVYLCDEDAQSFHVFWRHKCQLASLAAGGPLENRDLRGDRIYAEMKRTCDEYFFIPARKEHRGVGGIFFDRLVDESLGGQLGAAEQFTGMVAEGFMPSYLPLIARHCKEEVSEAMREWQLLRRGRYVEFNLLYDRGVRFGLAQLEKVMVSAPPLVAWEYAGPGKQPHPAADNRLLEVLQVPREWGFSEDEGELVEFLADDRAALAPKVAGVLPRRTVVELGLCFRGVGILVFQADSSGVNSADGWRVLCHHRSDSKSTYPGRWDMLVGGVPRVGELSIEAAARELREELGIDASAWGCQLRALGLVCQVDTGVVKSRCELFGLLAPHGKDAPSLDDGDGEATEVEWRPLGDLRRGLDRDRSSWVDSGLQVWDVLEAAGGPGFAAEVCAC